MHCSSVTEAKGLRDRQARCAGGHGAAVRVQPQSWDERAVAQHQLPRLVIHRSRQLQLASADDEPLEDEPSASADVEQQRAACGDQWPGAIARRHHHLESRLTCAGHIVHGERRRFCVRQAVGDDEASAGRDGVEVRLQRFAAARRSLGREGVAGWRPLVLAAADRPGKAGVERRQDRAGDVRAQHHASEPWIDRNPVGADVAFMRPAGCNVSKIADADRGDLERLRRLGGIRVRRREHEAVAVAVVIVRSSGRSPRPSPPAPSGAG